MNNIEEKLTELKSIAQNPLTQLKKLLNDGKKVIGCMPYFCPEELVYAAGMVPFGLLGAETPVTEAKRYWPSFICSVLQTILELGMRGDYNGIEAVMIPALCDGLKGMDGNWRYGVKHIPVISVAHAQNRKMQAGIEFTASQYRRIRAQLEEISGVPITDTAIADAISVYNKHRAVMRRFMAAAAQHPDVISPSSRSAVMKSCFFMPVEAHTAAVTELTDALEALPSAGWRGPRVVTSGVNGDHSGLLSILDSCGIAVIDDQVTNESLRFRTDIPVTDDPIVGMAQWIGDIEGCPVLFDPGKKRGTMLIELARNSGADGVLLLQTKFCDPEEYDYVPIKRMLDDAGIRSLLLETDLQSSNNEQARTAVEAFCESLL